MSVALQRAILTRSASARPSTGRAPCKECRLRHGCVPHQRKQHRKVQRQRRRQLWAPVLHRLLLLAPAHLHQGSAAQLKRLQPHKLHDHLLVGLAGSQHSRVTCRSPPHRLRHLSSLPLHRQRLHSLLLSSALRLLRRQQSLQTCGARRRAASQMLKRCLHPLRLHQRQLANPLHVRPAHLLRLRLQRLLLLRSQRSR